MHGLGTHMQVYYTKQISQLKKLKKDLDILMWKRHWTFTLTYPKTKEIKQLIVFVEFMNEI